jgi:hypothetical protein
MELVTRTNLEKGRKVIDEDNIIGTIEKCDNLHDVYVIHDNDMGSALYCFVEDCEENSEKDYPIYYI